MGLVSDLQAVHTWVAQTRNPGSRNPNPEPRWPWVWRPRQGPSGVGKLVFWSQLWLARLEPLATAGLGFPVCPTVSR